MKWIDLLHAAGQSWWQSLPLGPTGYGNSPYQSLSSFAGNGLAVEVSNSVEIPSIGSVIRGTCSDMPIALKAVVR